eukprot:g13118.t1
MRAVLEWEEQPADLDIWARNYDCYRNVEKAYSCDGQKPFEKPGWLSGATTCKRRPHCQSNHPGHNQYHKWVLFDTRFASKLSRRWKRRKIRDDVEAQTPGAAGRSAERTGTRTPKGHGFGVIPGPIPNLI